MTLLRTASLTLFIALFVSGCAGLRAEREYATPRMESPFRLSTWALYVPNRILDVLDVPVVGIQAGPGFNIRAQFTSLLSFCVPMNSCGPEVGLNTQWVDPIREDDMLPLWERYRLLADGCHGGKAVPFPIFNLNLGELDTSPDQVDIGAHVLLIGAHVGIRPVEIADLVTGFFLIDLNHDDLTIAPATGNGNEAREEGAHE